MLELTRRARSSRIPRAPDASRGSRPPDVSRASRPPDPRFPITEVDSVLPMLRTPQPAKRHGWRWALAVAFFLGFIGTTMVATPSLPFSIDGVAARLREAAQSLRGPPPLELPPVPASIASPGPTNTGAGKDTGAGKGAVQQRTDVVSSFRRESDGGADAGRPGPDAGPF